MHARLLWPTSLLGLLSLACDDRPPAGSATGAVGATVIDAPIDQTSEFWLQRKTTCAMLDQSIFHLSYGDGAVEISFQLDGGPSIFADITYDLPPTLPPLVSFAVVPSTPAVSSGTLTVGISGLRGRRTGTFHVVFADASMLDGDFDMPFEGRGSRPDCSGGGGGGGDDWD
jgi:hypothetical protein